MVTHLSRKGYYCCIERARTRRVGDFIVEDVVFARAPVRVCDIGGWTDTWFCNNGSVFNFCIDLYSYVRILCKHDPSIEIVSENLDISTEIDEFRKIEYNGTLDLLKSAIKHLKIQRGIKVFARSDAPPGCGTGTSASIAVAMVGALALLDGHYYVRHEIAQLAHVLETDELGLQSGVQDQYAAAYGGFNFMEIAYPNVKISKIDVRPEVTWELEQQLVLVYLESRSSSDMHAAVIGNYEHGDRHTLDAFDELKACPAAAVQALYKGDLEGFGHVMDRNWAAQKALHPKITNAKIDNLARIATSHHALGFKVNGAGGGGSAVILSSSGNEFALKKDILAAGYQILPCKINFSGLQAWRHR